MQRTYIWKGNGEFPRDYSLFAVVPGRPILNKLENGMAMTSIGEGFIKQGNTINGLEAVKILRAHIKATLGLRTEILAYAQRRYKSYVMWLLASTCQFLEIKITPDELETLAQQTINTVSHVEEYPLMWENTDTLQNIEELKHLGKQSQPMVTWQQAAAKLDKEIVSKIVHGYILAMGYPRTISVYSECQELIFRARYPQKDDLQAKVERLHPAQRSHA